MCGAEEAVGRGWGLLSLGCCSLPSPQSAGKTFRPFGQFILGSENKKITERTLDIIWSYLPFHRGGCAGSGSEWLPSTGGLVITVIRVVLVKPVSGSGLHAPIPFVVNQRPSRGFRAGLIWLLPTLCPQPATSSSFLDAPGRSYLWAFPLTDPFGWNVFPRYLYGSLHHLQRALA